MPTFNYNKEYWAVFYYGVQKESVRYNPKENRVKIPTYFDLDSSIIIVNIAEEKDTPTKDSVIARPLILLEQPGILTKDISSKAAQILHLQGILQIAKEQNTDLRKFYTNLHMVYCGFEKAELPKLGVIALHLSI